MDNNRKTMIELILHKKSIQIDETLMTVKEHLEKFYSNKEQETIAKTLESQVEFGYFNYSLYIILTSNNNLL